MAAPLAGGQRPTRPHQRRSAGQNRAVGRNRLVASKSVRDSQKSGGVSMHTPRLWDSCYRCEVPLNLVQRWPGHASMTTTAIYLQAMAREEHEIAKRMWANDAQLTASA